MEKNGTRLERKLEGSMRKEKLGIPLQRRKKMKRRGAARQEGKRGRKGEESNGRESSRRTRPGK